MSLRPKYGPDLQIGFYLAWDLKEIKVLDNGVQQRKILWEDPRYLEPEWLDESRITFVKDTGRRTIRRAATTATATTTATSSSTNNNTAIDNNDTKIKGYARKRAGVLMQKKTTKTKRKEKEREVTISSPSSDDHNDEPYKDVAAKSARPTKREIRIRQKTQRYVPPDTRKSLTSPRQQTRHGHSPSYKPDRSSDNDHDDDEDQEEDTDEKISSHQEQSPHTNQSTEGDDSETSSWGITKDSGVAYVKESRPPPTTPNTYDEDPNMVPRNKMKKVARKTVLIEENFLYAKTNVSSKARKSSGFKVARKTVIRRPDNLNAITTTTTRKRLMQPKIRSNSSREKENTVDSNTRDVAVARKPPPDVGVTRDSSDEDGHRTWSQTNQKTSPNPILRSGDVAISLLASLPPPTATTPATTMNVSSRRPRERVQTNRYVPCFDSPKTRDVAVAKKPPPDVGVTRDSSDEDGHRTWSQTNQKTSPNPRMLSGDVAISSHDNIYNNKNNNNSDDVKPTAKASLPPSTAVTTATMNVASPRPRERVQTDRFSPCFESSINNYKKGDRGYKHNSKNNTPIITIDSTSDGENPTTMTMEGSILLEQRQQRRRSISESKPHSTFTSARPYESSDIRNIQSLSDGEIDEDCNHAGWKHLVTFSMHVLRNVLG